MISHIIFASTHQGENQLEGHCSVFLFANIIKVYMLMYVTILFLFELRIMLYDYYSAPLQIYSTLS